MSAPSDDTTAPARRRRHTGRWIALAIGVVMIAFFVVLVGAEDANTRATATTLAGKPVPEVIGDTIDGDRYRISTERGKWVLVNFFATWCIPCREEHDDLIRFQEAGNASGDATVVGIIFSDSPEDVREFREKEGGDWPMVIDPNGSMSVDFGVRGVPESFLVSPDGVVVSKVVGGVRYEALAELLRRARGETPP